MKTLPTFRIRCSAIGQIMTNGRAKDTMGQTCITYLENWVKEQVYSKRKELYGNAIMKGTLQEDSAIELLSEVHGFMVKNERFFENEYMTGTPDILTDIVRDVKCSQDCFSFPLFESEVDKGYWYQLQGYMSLTGLKKASLDYCLVDSPDFIIDSDARKEAFKLGLDEVDEELYNKIKARHSYENTPIELRIKSFAFDYDADAIKAIEARVIECRNYIETVLIPKL